MMELPSTNWVPVARKVPETSYLVTGLKPDRDYKFRVTAETDQAKSEPSLSAVLHRKPGRCKTYNKLVQFMCPVYEIIELITYV